MDAVLREGGLKKGRPRRLPGLCCCRRVSWMSSCLAAAAGGNGNEPRGPPAAGEADGVANEFGRKAVVRVRRLAWSRHAGPTAPPLSLHATYLVPSLTGLPPPRLLHTPKWSGDNSYLSDPALGDLYSYLGDLRPIRARADGGVEQSVAVKAEALNRARPTRSLLRDRCSWRA